MSYKAFGTATSRADDGLAEADGLDEGNGERLGIGKADVKCAGLHDCQYLLVGQCAQENYLRFLR